MIKLGLTGSIGMGKSTTAKLFEAEGVPVYDADAAVHELYARGGAAVEPVSALFPDVAPEGYIDRALLSRHVLSDSEGLKALERVVHPLVGAHRSAFFERAAHEPVVVLDIPLLFETGGQRAVDAVVVVSAPEHIQRARVLEREGMTSEKLDSILARQLPDAEKRARADFVIDTGSGIEPARRQVRTVLTAIHDPDWWAARKRALDDRADAPQ